jgi:hypothetical protein
MHVTQLARGTINGADEIAVELREPDSEPATIWIAWPARPTICSPRRLNITIAAVMTILAKASTTHAQLRARRRK